MDKLLEEFKKYEMDNNQCSTISGGDEPPENGTNCAEDPTEPTTTCGGQTTTDYDWICEDESPPV
ncbi:MAG: hypothetical protein B6D64_10495 [Bacteroidetes bacterium 4484_276]|nr:MAG: hypothetical protein B6D64_10495 [Bacteroidetes bacterium 4484_276]